jgi:hypothetical protein
MANGKGIILAIAGLGGVALLARAASGAPAAKQQTYVDATLAKAQAATAKKGGTVDKAKTTVKKGTAEVRSAVNAIDKLLS